MCVWVGVWVGGWVGRWVSVCVVSTYYIRDAYCTICQLTITRYIIIIVSG